MVVLTLSWQGINDTNFSGATGYAWSPVGSKILHVSNKKKNFSIILRMLTGLEKTALFPQSSETGKEKMSEVNIGSLPAWENNICLKVICQTRVSEIYSEREIDTRVPEC
jgi:hypothetical protein